MPSQSKRPAVDLFSELEADYGPDGRGMNFGAILMPAISAAKPLLPGDLELSDAGLHQVLRAISTFPFVDKARRDPAAAAREIADLVRQASSHP